MSKLIQWVYGTLLFLLSWYAVINGLFPVKLSYATYQATLYLPVYLLMSFACYSLGVVGYRVATFNDCVEASEELKQQIEEAKKDLTKRGMKFS